MLLARDLKWVWSSRLLRFSIFSLSLSPPSLSFPSLSLSSSPHQLEDGHSLFDYDVGLNDIIQLMVRPAETSQPVSNGVTSHTNGASNGRSSEEEEEEMDAVRMMMM